MMTKDGIILLNKPTGITSFSAVAQMKRMLGVKCGHSGTLDPLATGLLPIMCGKATKLCSYLTDEGKSYRATLKFGIATDTYDITGKILKTDGKKVSIDEIEKILPEFTGKIHQVPPAFSAIKVDGVPLYKLARKGEDVHASEREISIYSINIVGFENNELTMDIDCSKGTYIRSLCNDIALRLGTVGTMSALTRTRTGKWTLDMAVGLDCNDIENHIISMDEALSEYPLFKPSSFHIHLLKNGCAVDVKKLCNIPDGISRVYDGDTLIGLGKVSDTDGIPSYKLITHL